MSSLLVLATGCAKITANSYCDVSSSILFGSGQTVDYLSAHDEVLLKDIIIHNETHRELCN